MTAYYDDPQTEDDVLEFRVSVSEIYAVRLDRKAREHVADALGVQPTHDHLLDALDGKELIAEYAKSDWGTWIDSGDAEIEISGYVR